jgi:hypothetical protein
VAAVLEKLKLLLGINDSAQDGLLNLLLEQTTDMVLSETNQLALPAAAQGLVVEMTEDAYRLHKQAAGEGAGEVTGSVSSISDNGQSVSYRDVAYADVLKKVAADVLKNYARRLDAFRRPRW